MSAFSELPDRPCEGSSLLRSIVVFNFGVAIKTLCLTAKPLVGLLALAACSILVQADDSVPRFEKTSEFPINLPKDQKIEVGFLVVKENRTTAASRLIRLPVAILRSASPSAEADPVIYLPGGPGTSALNTAKYGFAYPFLNHRDFIIFEPRGARLATPDLTCPGVAEVRNHGAFGLLSRVEAERDEIAEARACRSRLLADGIDPSAYTTLASATDLEDLRLVLGIKQWNFYAVSYGTRLALSYLKHFPGNVRSAVLDSVLPPTSRYDDHSAANLSRSFSTLFRDCTANTQCRERFPDLDRRWAETISAANRLPIKVTIEDNIAKQQRAFVLNGLALQGLVPIGSTGDLPSLPGLVDALARRDPLLLKAALKKATTLDRYSWGLRYSVWCTEEAPFAKRAKAELRSRLVVSPTVCAAWGAIPVPEREIQATVSDVPILLISGEYDPETPHAWALEAARTLSKAQAVLLRGMSHVPTQEWSSPCAMNLADSFLKTPTVRAELPCIADLRPPAFRTDKAK